MKLGHLIVAGTAALSLGMIATQAQARGDSYSQAGQSQSGSMSHSADVIRQAQEKLAAAGHDAGPVDGIAGPKTAQAVRSFQQAKGLSATGRLDQETLAALDISSGAAGATAGSAPERALGSQSQDQSK